MMNRKTPLMPATSTENPKGAPCVMTHKQYTISGEKRERLKTLTAIFCLLAVIIAGTVGLILENQPMEPDVVYPMTNRNITWTGAGYSGIYGGR